MERKPILSICLLAKTEVCGQTMGCLLNLINHGPLLQKVSLQNRLALGQSDLPKARSEQLTSWYKESQPGDIFMFLDSDQTFTAEDVLRSLSLLDKGDVVCGAYSRVNGTMTVEPMRILDFYRQREGPLWYGATGFMMISYPIVHVLVQHLQKEVKVSTVASAYMFFYERIVDEPELDRSSLWLSEDYSFCWLVRQQGGKIYGYISDTIGHLLVQEKMVSVPVRNKWPKKSIVYYCPATAEPWSPLRLKTGIGGSELAVLKLTPYWQKAGYNVTVFCSCDAPGVYDGVTYRRETEFNCSDEFDVLIVWRSTELASNLDFSARVCLLDLHDVVQPQQITKRLLQNVTKICVKSKYHAGMLGLERNDQVVIIPNGGAYEYEVKAEKDPNYLIYSSSYDRGLAFMLQWGWPRIKKACPQAYLRIYYGWNTFDALRPKNEDTKLFKKIITNLMNQDGVQECGRISQEELLAEKSKASIHWYTGDFAEIDCISVRESAAVGTIPIVTDEVRVFREKPYCITIPGDPRQAEMQERAADKIIELITDSNKMNEARQKLVVSRNETWAGVAEQWLKLMS